MSRISNYIFSSFLLVSFSVYGQAKQDTVRQKIKLTAVRIGVDLVQPIKTFSTDDFSGWEATVDAEFRNYYPVVELGQWKRDIVLSNGRYTNSGNYWRVGVDINLLKKDKAKNMFFFGLRYGRSAYREDLTYKISTDEFGNTINYLKNDDMKSGWAEMTTGLRVRVLKNFWMGYTGRLKFAVSVAEDQRLQSYDVPGYGLTFKKPWWGFNYYLLFNFGAGQNK